MQFQGHGTQFLLSFFDRQENGYLKQGALGILKLEVAFRAVQHKGKTPVSPCVKDEGSGPGDNGNTRKGLKLF
ncbi:MAG: hypothetical protein KKC20_20900 [Proteobacteria bacterium]|nr:hypothetical protein [Pseudomonadota bacterium]